MFSFFKRLKFWMLYPIMVGILWYALVGFKRDYFEIAKQIEIFTELYKQLHINYVDDTQPELLMNSAIEGLMKKLDPYTTYLTEEEIEKTAINSTGEFVGIGANISSRENKILIVEPWQGYPADLAGLKAGDEIIAIDGNNLVDFDGDYGSLLSGFMDSPLELTYKRQGITNTTTLTRTFIEIKAVPFYAMAAPDVGYVRLAIFNLNASSEVMKAVEYLKQNGARNIILDLRGNPGGLLSEAIKVANIFIDKNKLITQTISTVKEYNKDYITSEQAYDDKIPLAILIDGRSASASEIVAGAVQDYDRGVVVGARSYGKGLVQRIKPLRYGTELKITISRYHTPSGRCIQALDYNKRDLQGNAIKNTKDSYRPFTTKNSKRIVYDGGGIDPDIKIINAIYSPITYELLETGYIFDYATAYYQQNELKSLEEFSFTDQDYREFIAWLNTRDLDIETDATIAFRNAYNTAVKQNLGATIQNEYNDLMLSLEISQQKELLEKREEIKRLLIDEIIKRYFYREGMYKYQLENNEEIKEAVEVLNNSTRYRNILS